MDIWVLEWSGGVEVFDSMDECCNRVAWLAREGQGPGWFWNLNSFDRPRRR